MREIKKEKIKIKEEKKAISNLIKRLN